MLVINIAIRPEMQGTGLGKRLLLHAEAEARDHGCSEMMLYTHLKMTENQALYRCFGYSVVAERVEEGVERVYMEKPLGLEDKQ